MTYEEILKSLDGTLVRKAQPTPQQAHYNVPLNNIVIAYMQSAQMVSEALFPVVGVAKQSDIFYRYDLDTFYRDDAKPRAPSSESAGGGFSFDTDNYSCLVEAYHKDVDWQLRANADSQLQLDRAAALFVASKMVLRRETRFLSTFFKSGVWANDWSGVTSGASTNEFVRFDENTDPRVTIEAAKLQVLRTTGYELNVALFGAEVMSKLVTNPFVREQFKYTSAESINEAMVARYLGLSNVYVSKSVVATGPEGAAATVDLQAGKHVLLAHRASAPSVLAPSAGYTFAWTGYMGGQSISTARFPMRHLTSDRVESEMAYDFKVIAPALGVFLADAVS